MSGHPISLPNESAEYREARNVLLAAEVELREKIEAVAALRRALPAGGLAQDYTFDSTDGPVQLSDLFTAGKTSLILYSLMYADGDAKPCPMCTTYADGADGMAPQIGARTNFALVARAPLAQLSKLAAERGWDNLRLLSAANNSYATDYHSETPDGAQLPMVNVFQKTADGIRHFWTSEMFFTPSNWDPRHVDMLWPLWHYLDLTPEGRGDWRPSLD